MKRKPAKRKTTKKKPGLPAKPLRPPFTGPVLGRIVDLTNGTTRPAAPADFAGERERFPILPPGDLTVLEETAPEHFRVAKRFRVREIPLPPDFEEAVEHYAGDVFDGVYGDIVSKFDGTEKLEAIHRRLAALIRGGVRAAFQNGFYLALLHYADELKDVPAAVAMKALLDRGRKKGAAATKQKAEPRRKAIRRRFRELRQQGFTKEHADAVIAQDIRAKGERISEKTVFRARRGLS